MDQTYFTQEQTFQIGSFISYPSSPRVPTGSVWLNHIGGRLSVKIGKVVQKIVLFILLELPETQGFSCHVYSGEDIEEEHPLPH